MCGPSTIMVTYCGKILLLVNLLGFVISFTVQQHGTSSATKRGVDLFMAGESDFLTKIPYPFFAKKEGLSRDDDSSFKPSGLNSESFETVAAEILIAKAKAVIATDLGIQEPSLLDENFIWISPLLEKPLGKVDYLAAGKFFSLRTAFPDLDYRPHDFRIDVNDPLTVKCTVRPLGVMRGPLRLRTELVQPNGKQWRGPPEAISFTLGPDTGKVLKLCSGFAMDRLVGNTNGLCGVMAAATIAGVPPSDWEVYPIPVVISRFFGRPVDPINEVSTFLAPFPETVMIQLVKGVLTTDLAADDPSLLAKDFSFVTPLLGPIGRNKFLEDYARQEFGGFVPEFSHFRVDPFDPYRVWVDVKPVGPGLEGPPQAYSFTIDDDGFCTRITAGAVMDPSIGNTGGLAGAAGIKYALGEGDVDLKVRPLPVAIGRFKKSILSPLTKISTDDYVLDQSKIVSRVETPKVDPVEARKDLTEARARIQEKEAYKRQVEIEAQVRVRAQQKIEQEEQRMRKEAEEELQKFQEATQKELSKNTPEFTITDFTPPKLPTPPKITPPEFPAPPKVIPPTTRKVAKPKAGPPKPNQSIGKFFSFALIPLADLSAPNPLAVSKIDVVERKQKEAGLEAKRAATEKAQARKTAEAITVLAKKQKEAEERREKSEKKRKAATSMGSNSFEVAFLNAMGPRLSRQIPKAASKPAPIATPSPQRPSFQIPQFGKADAKTESQLKSSKPRPSFQIPQLDKATERPRITSSQLRPSLKVAKEQSPRPSLTMPKATKAPSGVPTIVAWRKRPDGGISGQIFGSMNFKEGERVETSPIARGEFQNGSVVTTESGSKYFLSGESVRDIRAVVAQSTPKAQVVTTSKPRATLQLTRTAKERDAKAAQAALEAASQTKIASQQRRPTFSLAALFGLDQPSESSTKSLQSKTYTPSPKVSRSPVAKQAPKGVPIIGRWKENRDKSITGYISGSSFFAENERVTTSPIARGAIASGEVVVTSSGSKYFLP